jgi:hypothetical protein
VTDERDLQASTAVADGDRIEQLAAEAVHLLGVDAVLDHATETVFPQFEDCDRFAIASPAAADSTFIALSLPIANALIHYATSRRQMADAKSWLRREWPEVADAQDPTSTLAALTLMHIVNEAWRRYRDDPEKKEIWARIKERVDQFTVPRSEATSVPPDR